MEILIQILLTILFIITTIGFIAEKENEGLRNKLLILQIVSIVAILITLYY